MSDAPLSFHMEGSPARFGYSYAGVDTVTSHTIHGPIDGSCYLVQGIDCSVSLSGGRLDGSYNLNGIGPVRFASSTIDPLLVGLYAVGAWRGAMPLGAGDTLELIVECNLPASLSIAGWGLLVPLGFAGQF